MRRTRRFTEQHGDVASRVMTWGNSKGVYPVALKGRVWVSANRYDAVHLETDLREPLPNLELTRDHLVIDYRPVNFDHGKNFVVAAVVRGVVFTGSWKALPSPPYFDQLRAFFRG